VYKEEPDDIDAGHVNGSFADASEAETEGHDNEGEPEEVPRETGTVDEASSAVEGEDVGNDSDFEASLASIGTALEEFDRLRGVTAGLGDVLVLLREQLVRQQGALATVHEARVRDQETIRELEAALATRDEVFETLRQQTSALSATLTDRAPTR